MKETMNLLRSMVIDAMQCPALVSAILRPNMAASDCRLQSNQSLAKLHPTEYVSRSADCAPLPPFSPFSPGQTALLTNCEASHRTRTRSVSFPPAEQHLTVPQHSPIVHDQVH